MRGRDLQNGIIDLARTHGWLVAHTPPVETTRGWRTPIRADGKGFPDLLMVRDRVIVAEIKGSHDRLRPEQEVWLHAFRLAGIDAYVWTAAEWDNGDIAHVLSVRERVPA